MNASSGEEVYIVGGRIWRSPAAIYFSKYACRVVMLIREMSQYLIDQIKATTNIEVRTDSRVAKV